MSVKPFPLRVCPDAVPDFVGFDGASAIEPALVSFETGPSDLPAKAKMGGRRAAKKRKRAHLVRVWFDDRELLKLNARAGADGMGWSDCIRVCVLRDSRRTRRPAPAAEDLFARAEPKQARLSRNAVRLSPELEARITAYFPETDVSEKLTSQAGEPAVTLQQGSKADLTGVAAERAAEARTPPPGQMDRRTSARDEAGNGHTSDRTTGFGKLGGFLMGLGLFRGSSRWRGPNEQSA
jgi:hypothetical protein